MYIGAKPNVANYTMLDSITTSATTTFNLTKDGVAFFPENPLGVICSLNGVIQKAGSSFNIVNSTIVFSSTLASTDVIDFILVMAQKIDLNTPADSSVTNAKTNFVSSSSSAGLQIKGDGTTDGTLQLNCSQNSHGIKLKSPNHASASSYTLTFPATDPSADKFLKTDGSGNLSFADAGGGGMDLISATSITGDVSEISTDAFSSTYNVYKVYIFGVKINGSTNNQGKIQFRTASGNYTSAGYHVVGYGQYMDSGSSNAHNAGQFPAVTAPDLNGWNIPDDNTQSGQATRDFEFTFYNTNSTTRQKNCKFYYGGWDENGTRLHWANGSITLNITTALTGFRFFSSGGTAFENEGKMLIYGLKES